MWGREARAGLVFVLLSLLAGGAFREWQASNETRFTDLVSVLERRNEELSREEQAGETVAGSSGGEVESSGVERPRRPEATLRPAALDVDRATAADFERLPWIGPSLAARIVADRERRGAFGTPEGLDRVPGIGPRTLERIRPFFATPPPAADSISPNAN